ncbi:MAG: ATP F0F1 synthase subunit B [Alphaproteobacteria bacterium]|nr:ATP F0F1 synthase subunit B [Alphaproteobacteria bacterium]
MYSVLTGPEFWVFIAFVVLMGAFAYLGIHKKLLTALDHRAERIRSELADAQRLKQEAADLLAGYKARRATAEREAEDIVASAKAEAERIAADAKAKMEDFVARRTKAAQGKIAMAEAQALAEVRAAAAEAAVQAATAVLTKSVKGKVADDLLARGISEVQQRLN